MSAIEIEIYRIKNCSDRFENLVWAISSLCELYGTPLLLFNAPIKTLCLTAKYIRFILTTFFKFQKQLNFIQQTYWK